MDRIRDRSDNCELGEIYLRKSRALGDADDPELLSHHLRALLQLAERLGLRIPEENILREIGSSETVAGRPLFKAKVEEWEARRPKTKHFLVVELERLSRASLQEAGRIMEAIRDARVIIHTPGRSYNLSASDDEFFYALGAILARRELAKYKERVELRRVEQVSRGLLRTGRPPWGYLWDRNQPGRGVVRPHPERFPILCAICQEVRYTSVVRLARKYGIPNATLLITLQNPAICGYPARRYNATLPGYRRGTRPLPRAQWVWPEGPADYPAACTREEWEAIQLIIEERTSRKSKTGFDENGWARDVIRFLDRPGPVRLSSLSDRRWFYEQFTHGAPRCAVPRREVHALVYEALRRFFSDPDAVREGLRNRTEAAIDAPEDPGLLAERRQLRESLDRLTEERAMLADAEARAANLRVQQRLEQRLRHVNGRIDRMAQERVAASGEEFSAEYLLEIGADFPAIWQPLPGHVKRALVNEIIEALPIKVEKPPGAKRYMREYRPVIYRSWVPPLDDGK